MYNGCCATGAEQCAEGVVRLRPPDNLDLSTFRTQQDCVQAAGSPEVVSAVEEVVTVWCKQIEQVCFCLHIERVILNTKIKLIFVI